MPDDITKAIIPKLFDVGRENSSCRTFEWKEPQITPFDTEELELVAKKMKSGEAPGLDGVPPEVIKEIVRINTDWILGVINDQLKKRSFLRVWKVAKVILLLKQGKDPEQAKS